MKASRPNVVLKCNVNLFHVVIVLFSKVVRQWEICNIFFYIICSIYNIILSASSTSLQEPLTFLQDPPAGPSCSYLLPSCRNHVHRTLLQEPCPQDPPAGSKTDLQEPFASCKKQKNPTVP
jgi:hypothetical protein